MQRVEAERQEKLLKEKEKACALQNAKPAETSEVSEASETSETCRIASEN